METVEKTKFLVVSRKSGSGLSIVRKLRQNPSYLVEQEETSRAALDKIKSGSFDCTILNIDRFEKAQANLVRNIRNLGFNFHIVVFADHIDEVELQGLKGIRDLGVFLKQHVNFEVDLDGLIKRFLDKSDLVAMRKHSRHPTNQKCTITNLKGKQIYSGRITNISKGGVCSEVAKGAFLLGDEVVVHTLLDEVGKTIETQGVIAWTTYDKAGVQSVGVRFVAVPKTVYKKAS